MVRLRRIPAIRAANVLLLTFGIPYGIVLLAFSLLFAPFYMIAVDGSGQVGAIVGITVLVGLLSAWAVAILFLWISIAIVCAMYNLIAGRLGGIELEFQTIPPTY